MLRVEGLGIGFRQRGLWRARPTHVVRGLSLQVDPCGIHALIGASGAGKSVVAMALMGLLPDHAFVEGERLWNGRPLCPQGPRVMGLMPQGPSYLEPRARVQAQIAWAARRAGVGIDWQAALARFDLPAGLGSRYPHQLSGGEARRVLLAIATLGAPQVLIVDEPTVGLDPKARATVLADLRAEAARGTAILLISHDLATVLPIADQVTLMGAPHVTHRAQAFAGGGEALCPQARAQWLALPENGMILDA